MSVPVGRRKQSRFEAQHQFYILRTEVTKLVMNSFGFSNEKYQEQIERYREAHKSASNVDEVVARWKAKAEGFYRIFIPEERRVVLEMLRKIESEFTFGNSIYPTETPAKVKYFLTETGKVVKRINPKSVTRERRRLKSYKRLMERGEMSYPQIEQAYKSWMGTFVKIMSKKQVAHMKLLFKDLYGKEPKWKR